MSTARPYAELHKTFAARVTKGKELDPWCTQWEHLDEMQCLGAHADMLPSTEAMLHRASSVQVDTMPAMCTHACSECTPSAHTSVMESPWTT